MAEKQDYYETLGVGKSADAKELKTVFRPTLELEIKQQFVYNAVVNTNNSISKEFS